DRTELSDLEAMEGSGLEALRGLGRANQLHATLTRLYVRLGAENLDVDDPLHGFFTDRYASGRGFIRSVLAAGQAEGTVRGDVDLDQIAAEALATLMGLEIQWLNDPEAVDLGITVDAYFDRLATDL